MMKSKQTMVTVHLTLRGNDARFDVPQDAANDLLDQLTKETGAWIKIEANKQTIVARKADVLSVKVEPAKNVIVGISGFTMRDLEKAIPRPYRVLVEKISDLKKVDKIDCISDRKLAASEKNFKVLAETFNLDEKQIKAMRLALA